MSSARPHPHLTAPLLHLVDLSPLTSDTELAEWFKECLPIRLKINREGGESAGGTVEFRDIKKAEKALTTLSPYFRLSPYPPPYLPLPPSQDSLPRIIMGFGGGTATAGEVWEMLRPVAIREIRVGEKGWPAVGGAGGTEAVVEFWFEDDARKMENDPPRSSTGHPLSIVPFNPHRQVPQQRVDSSVSTPSSFSIEAPAFIPTGPASALERWNSPGGGAYPELGAMGLGFGPGQQVQPAPPVGMGSTSASGLIDPCNLFCKNLDPTMSSNDLFAHFRSFGRIVSARVMRDDAGTSKGFGFVSFQTPQEAHLALSMMDGVTLGTKQITVRLHEPKRFRAEKLADRARTGSMSPTSGQYAQLAAEGGGSPGHGHGRRLSGSGHLATPPQSSPRLNIEELQSMTPERRKSVLTFEVGKRVREMGPNVVKKDEVDGVVSALVGLDLGLVDALKDRTVMGEKVNDALALFKSDPSYNPSSTTNNATLSPASTSSLAPTSTNTTTSPTSPPTTTSASSQQTSPSPASERDRLLAAITKLEPSPPSLAKEITEMVLSLSKKERALCLFNVDFLRGKVNEAKEVLTTLGGDLEDDELAAEGFGGGSKFKAPFATPQRTKSAPVDTTSPLDGSLLPGTDQATASTPTSPAAVVTGLPIVEGEETKVGGGEGAQALKEVKEIASWGTKEILEYLRENEGRVGELEGVRMPEEGRRREMEVFLEGVSGKPVAQQKQALGERLFKVMKTWDLPRSIRAPKVTVQLLDNEDFVSLGHLLAEFPSVLKEKVLLDAK